MKDFQQAFKDWLQAQESRGEIFSLMEITHLKTIFYEGWNAAMNHKKETISRLSLSDLALLKEYSDGLNELFKKIN